MDQPLQTPLSPPTNQPALVSSSQEHQPSLPQTPRSPNKFFSRTFLYIILIIIAIIVGGLIGIYSLRNDQPPPSLEPPSITSRQHPLPDQDQGLRYQGSQMITLREVSSSNFSAVAFRVVGPFSILYSILADLPDPPEGSFYQVWIVKTQDYTGSDPANAAQIGRMEKYLLEGKYSFVYGFNYDPENPFFREFTDLHNGLGISLETSDDNVMETKILEGIFTK